MRRNPESISRDLSSPIGAIPHRAFPLARANRSTKTRTMRRFRMFLFLLLLQMTFGTVALFARETNADYRADFKQLTEEIETRYASFSPETQQWDLLKKRYEASLSKVNSREQFTERLERFLDEFADSNLFVATNTAASYRLIPARAVVWAELQGNKAVITSIRPGTTIDPTVVGGTIRSVGGTLIDVALNETAERCINRTGTESRNYFLLRTLAGRYGDKDRLLEVDTPAGPRTVELDREIRSANTRSEARLTEGGIGYIRFSELSSPMVIAFFYSNLDKLRASRGLVIDLRDIASGGNNDIVRAILGRFVNREKPWELLEDPRGMRELGIPRRWQDLVSPVGPWQSDVPTLVWVSRWTAGTAEALACGLGAAGGGRLAGTPMAGIRGRAETIVLKQTKIPVNLPVEKCFQADGTAREAALPLTAETLTNDVDALFGSVFPKTTGDAQPGAAAK